MLADKCGMGWLRRAAIFLWLWLRSQDLSLDVVRPASGIFFFKIFISFKPQILKAGPDGTDRIKTGKTGTQATVSGCIRVLSLDIKECTEYVSAFLM